MDWRAGPPHTATKLVTAPTVEPFTLADAKRHCKIDIPDDDLNVLRWIRAARTKVERDTGRALLTQTWDLFTDAFYSWNPSGIDFAWPRYSPSMLLLPYPPLQSVTAVYQTDTTGAETVWNSTNYVVDTASQPGRIGLTDGGLWPTGMRVFQPGRIRFIAGWTSPALIPDDLQAAMALLIGWFSLNRQPSAIDDEVYQGLIANSMIHQAA